METPLTGAIAFVCPPVVGSATAMESALAGARQPSIIELSTLLKRVSGQDQDALAELYDRTCAAIYGIALRILRDPTAAEDVTLQVYSQAWSKAASFDEERGTALTWLLAMARNRSIDALRALQREPGCDRLEAAEQIRDPGPNPEEGMNLMQRGDAVRDALARLPGDQRQLIELAFFGGFSHAQIAERESLPLGTIKTRIRAGMLRLRTLLSESNLAPNRS